MRRFGAAKRRKSGRRDAAGSVSFGSILVTQDNINQKVCQTIIVYVIFNYLSISIFKGAGNFFVAVTTPRISQILINFDLVGSHVVGLRRATLKQDC